jgi:hypothetical protein
MQDKFWEELVIPFQEEDGNFQYANPVVVGQYFIKAVGVAAFLGQQAETLTEQIGNLRVSLDRKKRDLAKVRRKVLSESYKEVKSSASTEVQDAFVHRKAHDLGFGVELETLENEVEALVRELEIREPRLDQYRSRLKLLELSMNWGKQYLDFEKLVIRSSNVA